MEAIRDIVIIVFGIGATVAVVVLLIMALSVYRRVSAIIDSVKSTVNGIETFSRDVLSPLSRSSSAVTGGWKILTWVLGKDRERRDR